jgi:hypothetical protein
MQALPNTERCLMKFDLEKHKLLILLLIADAAFLILHILYINTDFLTVSLYSLSRDRGYAEFFQYTKELWIAVLLLLVGIKRRRGLFFPFSLLFIYFLIDDSLEFHENFGKVLADFLSLQPGFGLRAVDFGELFVSGLFGLLFFISIALFYFLSDQPTRRIAQRLVVMIIVMAFFGLFLDMVAIVIPHRDATRVIVALEEWGEMLVMSVITWFVFNLSLNGRKAPGAEQSDLFGLAEGYLVGPGRHKIKK